VVVPAVAPLALATGLPTTVLLAVAPVIVLLTWEGKLASRSTEGWPKSPPQPPLQFMFRVMPLPSSVMIGILTRPSEPTEA